MTVRITTLQNHTYVVEALEVGGEVIPAHDRTTFIRRVPDTVYKGVFHATQRDGTSVRLIIPGRDVRIVSSTPPRAG